MAPAQTALERRVEQIADSLEGDDGLRVRLALVERGLAEHRAQSALQHQQEMAAIEGLRTDLSDQGRTPIPAPAAAPRSWIPLPAPSTVVEYAKAIGLLIPVLAAIYGVSYSGAQSGGSSAVETAVEQGEAVPVATPPTLVPQVVPVPMPQPPVEPDPVVRPDDPILETR